MDIQKIEEEIKSIRKVQNQLDKIVYPIKDVTREELINCYSTLCHETNRHLLNIQKELNK